jgi:hypothetical protein
MTDVTYKTLVIIQPSMCRYRLPYEGNRSRTEKCMYDLNNVKECESPFSFPKHCPLKDSDVEE